MDGESCLLGTQGQIKQLRSTGRDASKHKEAIEGDDLVKIYTHGDVRTAPGLHNKVFIDLLLHFARHDREGLRELSKNSFIIETDSAGLRFAKVAYHKLDKKPQWIG